MITFSKQIYVLGVLSLAFLLALLLFRNPFSERTLIPNFEPFPDSFHYIVPVRNFIAGKDFSFSREGLLPYNSSVPPLYSILLLPAFLVLNEPRMFYVVNVVLSFVSFFLLERILHRTVPQAEIRLFLLFLFVTSHAVSWIPSLAMAENLLLPLVLLCTWLLTLPVTDRRSVVMGLLTWSLYGTKYAAAPLTAVFTVLFLWKSWKEAPQQRLKSVAFVVMGSAISFAIFSFFEYWQKGKFPFISLFNTFFSWFHSVGDVSATSNGLQSFFSLSFLPAHWPAYMSGLFGNATPLLWSLQPILLSFFAVIGGVGILYTLFRKERRDQRLAAGIFLLLLAQATFMSTFYVVDMRFLYAVVPLLLIGVGWYLQALKNQKIFKETPVYFAILAVFFLFAFISQVARLRVQFALNLKYSETPWYYLSIKHADEYLTSQPDGAVLISALDPYLIDFYKKGSYKILPLSEEQNHTPELWPQIWGDEKYEDFREMYRSQLQQGKAVYALQYGLGNEQPLHEDWKRLEESFSLTLVQDGCHSLCGIYKVEEKQ